jgi:type IV secretory pathway VirB4 component
MNDSGVAHEVDTPMASKGTMAIYRELLDRLRWKAAHLSDLMPWRVVGAPGVIVQKQSHALQRSYALRGPDLTSEVHEVMGALMLQANNVFKRLRGQWTVHCEAQRLRVTAYPLGTFPCRAAQLIDEARRREIFRDPGKYETCYYLTVTWQPPSAVKALWSGLFVSGAREANGQGGPSVAEFVRQADYLMYLLRGMLAVGRPLTDDETLTYLHNSVSDRWHPVRLPALPIDIDIFLCDRPFRGGWYPHWGPVPQPGMPDDRTHLRVCSIQGYPPQSLANAMQALDHLGFPYRWSTRWIAMEQQTQQYLLQRVQRQWVGQEKTMRDVLMEKASRKETRILNTTATNFATDADEARQELGADVVAFGDFTSTVTVWDRDLMVAERRLEDVRQMFEARGFTTIKETEHATAAWLSSLPGNRADNVRRTPQHSLTFAHLAPGLAAAWPGAERDDYLDGPPWFLATTETNTLFRVVNHVLDVGHTLVLGPTGSGKSTLLGLMTAQWLKYPRAQAFVFDVGRTARCMCLCLGGHWYDLGSEAVAFQPLRRCHEPAWRRWGFDWLVSLMDDARMTITGSLQAYLQLGLDRLAKNPAPKRTLTELELILTAQSRQTEVSASKRTALQETLLTEHMAIRQVIHGLTRGTAHGNLLDSDHDDLQEGYLHVFEQEDLLKLTHLVGPVTRYLFHAVEERFSTDTPTWLPMDEAAIAWIVPGISGGHELSDYGEQGREWMMTTRKRGVSLGFFTHSISQVFASPLGLLLMESCPTWYMLPNKAASSPELADIYRRMGFNDAQIQLITTARPQRDVYYRAEMLGKRLLSVPLSDLELAMMARNDDADHRLMDQMLAEHGREGFLRAWLDTQGFPDAWEKESYAAD